MKEHRIVIEIDEEGKISADAEGFEGDACLEQLERLLGELASHWSEMERKPEAAPSQINQTSNRTIQVGKKS